jgi:hypothetical protein
MDGETKLSVGRGLGLCYLRGGEDSRRKRASNQVSNKRALVDTVSISNSTELLPKGGECNIEVHNDKTYLSVSHNFNLSGLSALSFSKRKAM